MADLIARYGDIDLPVISVENGMPLVFHDGKARPAADVRIGRESLDSFLHVPQVIPAQAGLWADFEWTHDDGERTRESFPVVAFQIDPSGTWRDGYTISGDGIKPVFEMWCSTWRFLGYRLEGPTPYCAYEEDQ